MSGRFVHEALEAVGLPEFSGTGIGGVDCQLWREQHGIDAGIGDLLRHQLPVAHVAFERGAIAVEEHHDHAGFSGVEMLGHMHQHAAVVIGLVLPVDLSGITAVAAAIALRYVKERRLGARIVAEIGEGRGFHADQRGQVVARPLEGECGGIGGDAVWGRRGVGRDPFGSHRALTRGFARRPLDAFGFRGESVLELRCGEAVVERVGGRMRIRSQRSGGGRLAALNQDERQRHESSEEGNRAPARRHVRGRRRHRASKRSRFRIRSEHPPPKIHQRQN